MVPHATDSISSANQSESNGTSRIGNGDAVTGMASKLERYPETDISVLIVGSGIGGLMTALECWRKGLSIKIWREVRDQSTQVSCSNNGQLTLAENPNLY